MSKLNRTIEINGENFNVPTYITRTKAGWQARVHDVESRHYADVHYGGPSDALKAASRVIKSLLETRNNRANGIF